MILKQNCFVISDTELAAYRTNSLIQTRTSYTGSSLQRLQNKDKKLSLKYKDAQKTEIVSNSKKINLSHFGRVWDDQVKEQKRIKALEAAKAENARWLRDNGFEAPLTYSLSAKSKTKIRQKLIAWSQMIPNKQSVKFTFCTLTLTSEQIGDDKGFTKMLNSFFTYLRTRTTFYIKYYMYVLEKQACGNTHAHIIFSQFLPIRKINAVWCSILTHNGYLFNQAGVMVTPLQAIKNKLENPLLPAPNPVDISVVHDIKALTKYVTKYITKSSSTLTTNIWNCSKAVSRIWTGAKISAKTYLNVLEGAVTRGYEKVLDGGEVLNVYLLSYYTGIQKKIFQNVNIYQVT